MSFEETKIYYQRFLIDGLHVWNASRSSFFMTNSDKRSCAMRHTDPLYGFVVSKKKHPKLKNNER